MAKNSYLYAWITEFSIAAPDIRKALDQLERRTAQIQESQRSTWNLPAEGPQEYEHHLMATFGSTDIVEISYFSQIYHYFEIAETSAHSSRNAVGARCLTDAEQAITRVEGNGYRLCSLPEILGRKPELPFLATIYLRISTAARLCVPPTDSVAIHDQNETLIGTFIRHLFQTDAPVWSASRKILKKTLGDSERVRDSLITPLIGLDSVDVVLILRAERLEQIAATTWALRHARLGSVWSPSGEDTGGEAYISAINGLLHGDLMEVTANWRVSPLFREVRAIWGVPLKKQGRKWRMIRPPDGAAPAAKEAVQLAMLKAAPDRFKQSIRPAEPDFLMLFGRSDNLIISPETLSEELSTANVFHRFSHLANLDPQDDPLEEGIWPTTEIAVGMRFDKEIKLPTYGLMRRFRRLLKEAHAREVDRNRKDSLTSRWLSAAETAAASYATTNTVVNMIAAFMGYLERDPEGFTDLLPVIRRLVVVLEKKKPSRRELIWMVANITSLFTFLSCQYYPLQSPNSTLPLGGSAGYRRSRDAFIGFANVLAQQIVPGSQVLVLEAAGGGLTSETGAFGFVIFRAPPFSLHYPVTWLVASELAHSRLSNTVFSELRQPLARAKLRDMCEEFGSFDPRTDDSVRQVFNKLGGALEDVAGKGYVQPFIAAFKANLTEVIADLVLRRSLQLSTEGPHEAIRRYWFVHGPGLVSSARFVFGKVPDLPTINVLITRVFFTNYIFHVFFGEKVHDALAYSWCDEFLLFLKCLRNTPFALENYADTLGLDLSQRACVYAHCLRLDLRISDERWETAVDLLSRSLEHIDQADDCGRLKKFVGNWLLAVQAVADYWLLSDFKNSCTTDLYCNYLSWLIDKWKTSDPWPPFVEHHGVQTKDDEGRTVNASARRERLRKEDPEGGFISLRGGVFVRRPGDSLEAQQDYYRTTGLLIRRLEDLTRSLRLKELQRFLRPPL